MIERDAVSRRHFLRDAGATAAVVMLTRDHLGAAQNEAPATPVNVGVIGTGQQGQLLLARLARVPGAHVVAMADTYEPSLKKAAEIAPKAAGGSEYRAVIDRADAIVIATPTALHKQIALDAIAAGKHVYVEAPLATTIEEAKAIAKAGADSKKVFVAGLHQRMNAMYKHTRRFVLSEVLGDKRAMARAQYHKKTAWKRPATNLQIERQLNWKLDKARSNGLMGEIGTHQIDVFTWFFRRAPLAVTGFGAVRVWDDGRDMPDTIQCVFEYPNDLRVLYDATLGNSFEGNYELLCGNNAAVMLRDNRAWVFKEADSPALGWETYAKHDKIGDEEGIALVADASKLIAIGKDPAQDGDEARAGKDAYYDAMEEFLDCIRQNKKPTSRYVEGLQATVVGIKAAQAIGSGDKVKIAPEDLAL